MKIEGKDGRALWFENGAIQFIDQRKLPYKLEYYSAKTVDECAFAIKDMVVRGAPAIGAAAVYGMVLGQDNIKKTAEVLRKTRPTAYDLFYAIYHILHFFQVSIPSHAFFCISLYEDILKLFTEFKR